MAATDIFNDGSLAAQWTVEAGVATEEGASGKGSLVMTVAGTPIDPLAAPVGIRADMAAGDFDIVLRMRRVKGTTGVAMFVGLSVANLANTVGASIVFNNGNFVACRAVDNSAVYAQGDFAPESGWRMRDCWSLRIKRTGTDLYFYTMTRNPDAVEEPGTWLLYTGPQTDLLAGGAGYVRIGGRTTDVSAADKIEVLAFYASLPSAPAAPANGQGVSAPLADDSDYGVAFVWDAPSSNVARTVEIQMASDSGFTTGVLRHFIDFMMDGEKPSHRCGGLALNETVYARARFVDELGQAGTWSDTVDATAEAYPQPAEATTGGGQALPHARTIRYTKPSNSEALQKTHDEEIAGLLTAIGVMALDA